jgi:hypothetical protein
VAAALDLWALFTFQLLLLINESLELEMRNLTADVSNVRINCASSTAYTSTMKAKATVRNIRSIFDKFDSDKIIRTYYLSSYVKENIYNKSKAMSVTGRGGL